MAQHRQVHQQEHQHQLAGMGIEDLPCAGKPVVFSPPTPPMLEHVVLAMEIEDPLHQGFGRREFSARFPLNDVQGKSSAALIRACQARFKWEEDSNLNRGQWDALVRQEYFNTYIFRAPGLHIKWCYPDEPLPLQHDDAVTFYPSRDKFLGRCGKICKVCSPGPFQLENVQYGYVRRCAQASGHFQALCVCDMHEGVQKWWRAGIPLTPQRSARSRSPHPHPP